MYFIKTTFYSFLSLFTFCSLFAQPVTWVSSTSYSTGALVVVIGETSTYIATQSVPANNSPPNTTYWTNLSVAATALNVPVEDVPSLDTATILDSLPKAAPDANSTGVSTSNQLLGISTNAVTTNAASVVAGITIIGGTKKVVFQVQGAATYPSDSSFLSDPRLSIYSGSTMIAQIDDWQSGPVSFDSTYYQSSYASDLVSSKYAMTGSMEPAIILNLPVGSYTALVDGKGVEGKVVIGAFDID